MEGDWIVIWEFSDASAIPTFGILLPVFVLIGPAILIVYRAGLAVRREESSNLWTRVATMVGADRAERLSQNYSGLIVGGLWTVATILLPIFFVQDYLETRRVIASQAFEVVRGEVADFRSGANHRGTASDRPDTFSVSGRGIEYDLATLSGCFCYTRSEMTEPAISNGDFVELWMHDGEILRLSLLIDDGTAPAH